MSEKISLDSSDTNVFNSVDIIVFFPKINSISEKYFFYILSVHS